MAKRLTIPERKFLMAAGVFKVSLAGLATVGMIKSGVFTGMAVYCYVMPVILGLTGIDTMTDATKTHDDDSESKVAKKS